MHKHLLVLATLCCGAAFANPAADINGHWTATVQAKRAPQPVELDLQVNDNQLSGEVGNASVGKKKAHARAHIENGVFDGSHFSFTTLRTSKKGPVKFVWEGNANGDELQGTRTREGGKHGIPFTAKRSS